MRKLYTKDGIVFSDKAELRIVGDDEYTLSMTIEPDMLYHPMMHAINNFKTGEDAKAKRLAGLLKVALKGGLLMYGDQLLKLFYGDSPTPSLTRGEDIFHFYSDQFVRLLLTWLVKQDIVVVGIRQDDSSYAIAKLVVSELKDTPKSQGDVIESILEEV